jgi:2'-5' RNA ligase
MPKEQPSTSPGARLFVALDLPGETLTGIGAWAERELVDPALRGLAAASMHVTMVFLGCRAETEIAAIAAVVESLEPASPRLELRDPVGRPERGSPRLYALPVESRGLVGIQRQLERKLVEEGLHEPERRAFWPHVTVARVKPERRGSRRPRRVERPPGPLPQELVQPTRGVRISLYLSKLQPQGAEYVPLAHVKLR